MKPTPFGILTLLFLVSTQPVWAEPSQTPACLERLAPLHNKVEAVAELDGVWGLFQKTPELQGYSALAVDIDKKANSIIFHLEYLCQTIEGIPFDELSDYVSKSLAEKGEDKFRKELIILGKSEGEIDVWFEFTRFAIANRYRTLDPQRIYNTIQSAQPLIEDYSKLAEKLNNRKSMTSTVQESQGLTALIEEFFKSDPYMSKAIHENAQVPYADFDENYGGS